MPCSPQDWLYDEGEDTTKGVYLDKLASLRKVGDPIEARAREHMERPGEKRCQGAHGASRTESGTRYHAGVLTVPVAWGYHHRAMAPSPLPTFNGNSPRWSAHRPRSEPSPPRTAGAISHLEATCARYLELASSAAPEHAHISEDDRGKVRAECEAALSWLKEKRGYQESLAKTDDPVLTVEEMRKKADTVERVCKPVMSQPAPAPKKEEKAEEKAKEEAKEGGEGGEAMETDDGADGANGGGEGEGAMETD